MHCPCPTALCLGWSEPAVVASGTQCFASSPEYCFSALFSVLRYPLPASMEEQGNGKAESFLITVVSLGLHSVGQQVPGSPADQGVKGCKCWWRLLGEGIAHNQAHQGRRRGKTRGMREQSLSLHCSLPAPGMDSSPWKTWGPPCHPASFNQPRDVHLHVCNPCA